MDILGAVILWTLFGLVVGAIARLLIPGRQAIGFLGTILLGITGSLLGGFVAWIFVGGSPFQASGWILSILGAVVLLAIGAASSRRRHTI